MRKTLWQVEKKAEEADLRKFSLEKVRMGILELLKAFEKECEKVETRGECFA